MITIGKFARSIASDFRKNPTNSEALLWEKLHKRQFCGLKFLFQHPIFFKENLKRRFFIADFYCSELKLLIEIDGEIHRKHVMYDKVRTDILTQKNISIIRYTNAEVINNINKVLIELKRKVDDQD